MLNVICKEKWISHVRIYKNTIKKWKKRKGKSGIERARDSKKSVSTNDIIEAYIRLYRRSNKGNRRLKWMRQRNRERKCHRTKKNNTETPELYWQTEKRKWRLYMIMTVIHLTNTNTPTCTYIHGLKWQKG